MWHGWLYIKKKLKIMFSSIAIIFAIIGIAEKWQAVNVVHKNALSIGPYDFFVP